MPPVAEPPDREIAQSGQQNEATTYSFELLHELTEALTAITNYLEAANRLDDANTSSARTKLGEALDKSLAQLSRASGVLRRLRALLRDEKGAGND
jgi:phosphoglycerate-specific signal transduction histidine kinase